MQSGSVSLMYEAWRRIGFGLVLGSLCMTVQAQPVLDVYKLLSHVEVLASDSLEGRRTGTQGNASARTYLQAAFEGLGLLPLGEQYEHPFSFPDRKGERLRGVNLLGYVQGSERPDSFIVVTAHFDHLGVRNGEVFNGADDNASGVAGMLALAAHFAQHPPHHSVIFAALDAEEMGLQGARAFLDRPPVDPRSIRLNVNLDMIGRNERNELYAAGTAHYPFFKPWLQAVAETSPITLLFGHDGSVAGQADWTTSSDHGPFHQAGIPFVYFGVEDHPDYHKESDEFDRIDPDFFAAAVRTILEAVVLLDQHLDGVLDGKEPLGSE